MASGQQFIAKTVDLNQLLPGKIYLTCSLIGECTLLLDRTEGQFQANMDMTPKKIIFLLQLSYHLEVIANIWNQFICCCWQGMNLILPNKNSAWAPCRRGYIVWKAVMRLTVMRLTMVLPCIPKSSSCWPFISILLDTHVQELCVTYSNTFASFLIEEIFELWQVFCLPCPFCVMRLTAVYNVITSRAQSPQRF